MTSWEMRSSKNSYRSFTAKSMFLLKGKQTSWHNEIAVHRFAKRKTVPLPYDENDLHDDLQVLNDDVF